LHWMRELLLQLLALDAVVLIMAAGGPSAVRTKHPDMQAV